MRRYDFAMQKRGRQKNQKGKAPMKGLEFQMVAVSREPKESDYEASWRRDVFLPEETVEDKAEAVTVDDDLPLTVHAVGIGEQNPNQIGQEFSGITDRISKLLTDYESMYDDKDQQGYAAMQELVGGQIAMEDLLSDYKSLCHEREDLLSSLYDSLDMDEEELLNELEAMSKKDHSIDMEGAQQAIHDTFQHVRDTTNKLKMMNKTMIDLSKAGEATECLEQEKRQLERELQMYKKMAVQQRKDILNRRSSVRKDDIQQWKLVAGEMLDMLNTVRDAGKLDKDSLEKELGKIIMTVNSQTDYIDNLKKELSKQEKGMKNLEKDKIRLNNDKRLVEDELRRKQIELKQFKQYLRSVVKAKKDEEKTDLDEAEIDLADEMKLNLSGSPDMATTDILKAQVRDARKIMLKLEEKNRELQSKLASLSAGVDTEAPAGEESTSLASPAARDTKSAHVEDCPKCFSYKARLANCLEELKEKSELIKSLKEELSKLSGAQLSTSEKETDDAKSEQALAEEEIKEERLQSGKQSDTTSSIQVVVETAATASQASSDRDAESEEEPIKDKPKKTSTLLKPGKKTKQKALKSTRRHRKVSKAKEKSKEDEKGDDKDDEEEVVEEGNKKEAAPLNKMEKEGSESKRRGLAVGKWMEEKTPYVTVREAKMVTLADKGTQTSDYDRKALEGNSQRQSVVRQLQHRRRPLAETILAGVVPSAVEEETNTATTFIKDEADRLCDEIAGFLEYGFDFVQQGAKSNRLLIDRHLGEKATELLESSDNGPLSIDRAKALKALMSSDHRRQSLSLASKKRRRSLQLERKGNIRRDSKVPLEDTPTDGMFGRKREDSISTEMDNAHPKRDSLAEQKGDTLASAVNEIQTEQGPPEVRRNPLFPDQDTTNAAQTQENNRSSKEPQPAKESDDDRGTKVVDETGQSVFTQDKEAASLLVPEDAAFVKKNKWSTLTNFFHSLQPFLGGGCSHVLDEVKNIAQGSGEIPSEDQIKKQVTVMGQHAIDTIQSAAQVMKNQLEEELTLYEKFYRLWEKYRDEKKPSSIVDRSDEVPVAGVKILSTLDERGNDAFKTEESTLLPPIIPQESSYQTFGRRKSIALVGLSREGMMRIQGAGPTTAEPIPTSISQSTMKKRGKVKNWSRKQLLMRQKAVLDKVLHVDAKIEDLRNIFSQADEKQRHYIRQTQGILPTISQDFYLPLTAHSVALPSLPTRLQMQGTVDQHLVKQEKEKKEAPMELSREDKSTWLPHMSSTSAVWQRRQSIVRFPSQRTVQRSYLEQEAKLPLLNMNRFLKVGQ